MSIWEREHGGTTRGRIVALLRARHHSVEELAAELGLTDNAVRAHLIVSAARADRASGRCSPRRWSGEAGDNLRRRPRRTSSFFASVFASAVGVARGAASARARGRVAPAAQARRAPHGAPHAGAGALEARVRAASKLLDDLGGSTTVSREGDAFVIRGHGCPLSEAVASCPETCVAVEQNAERGEWRDRRRVVRSERASELPLSSVDTELARGANHFERPGT